MLGTLTWRACAVVGIGVLAVCLHNWSKPDKDWGKLSQANDEALVSVCQVVARRLRAAGFWEDNKEKEYMMASGALATILREMGRRKDSLAVQFECMDLLAVSVAGVGRHQAAAGKRGALEVVLQAMRVHPHQAMLVGRSATTLGVLCDHCANNSEAFAKMGAVELFFEALRDHGDNPQTLFELYCGFTGITCHNVSENNQKVVELGLIEIGIQHMYRFPAAHSLREEVMPVLNCLSVVPWNETNRQRIIDGGYMQAVLSAMRDFPGDQRLVSKGLESIRDFSIGRPDWGVKWREAGAIPVMAEVMANFQPLKEGAVFWNVHTSGAEGAWVLAHEGPVCWAAMRRAKLHKQLVRSLDGDQQAEVAACNALRMIATDGPEARRELYRDGVPARCLPAE